MAAKRPTKTRKNREILIISEDEKSFILYFEKLLQEIRYHKTKENKKTKFKTESAENRNGITTIIELTHIGRTDPLGIIEKAKEKSSEYKKIFCVFDAKDEEQLREFLKIETRTKNENIEKIISVPCYEAWLLMHFTIEEVNKIKYENADNFIEKLSEKLGEKIISKGNHKFTYKKEAMPKNLFSWLYANLNTAKENAEKLRKAKIKRPSTEIDLLINELENFSVA